MSIRNKLFLSFAIVFLLFLTISVNSFIHLNKISKSLKNEIPNTINQLEPSFKSDKSLQLLRYFSETLYSSLIKYIYENDSKALKLYYSNQSKLNKALKNVVKSNDNASDLNKSNQELRLLEKNIIALAKTEGLGPARKLMKKQSYSQKHYKLQRTILNYFTNLGLDPEVVNEEALVAVKLTAKDTEAIVEKSLYITIFLLVFFFIIIFFLTWMTEHQISKPLNNFLELIDRLAKGERNIELNIVSNDEIGALALAFQRLSNELAYTTVSRDELLIEIEQRNELEYQLAQKVELNKAILDTANDAIITINKEAKVQSFNKAAETIFGYSENEVLGKNINILMPSPYTEEHDEYLKQHLLTGVKKAIGMVREVEGKRKNGEIFPIELSVSKASTGTEILFTGIVRDVSEKTKLLLNLKRSNQELEQFAYVASHDLQEPLRTVSSYVELVVRKFRQKDHLTDDEQKYMAFITDGIKRMRALVNGVLSFSRIGRSENYTELNLQETIESILVNIQKAISDSKATINYPEMPTITANDNEIYLLFQNLISNAIKFKAESDPVVDINVKEEDDAWHFSVKDNGIGMKEEYFEKIFVIFQRLHSRDEYKGTGIGLALCKKIVERHNGKIWVESTYGEGSHFHFTLSKML